MCRRLDTEEIRDKILNLFQSPGTFPELPKYIVAAWRLRDESNSGAVFNTFNLGDLAHLLTLLNHPQVEEIILYEFDPVDYVFNKEFLRMTNPVEELI